MVFVSYFVFLTKLLTSRILFSATDNADFVDKLQTSGILSSNSVSFVFLQKSVTLGILVFYSVLFVFKTNTLVSILFTFAANLSYAVFLTTSFFTTSLSLLKSTGTAVNLSIYNLSILVFRLLIQLLNELLYPFHLTYNLSPFLLITFSTRNFS